MRSAELGAALAVLVGLAVVWMPTANPYVLYLRFLLRHKLFVFLYCCTNRIPWRGFLHDFSKFRPSEFLPYARYFFGDRTVETRRAFDRAWHWHYTRNRHHWEHWVITRDGLSGVTARQLGTVAISGTPIGVERMTLDDMREMLADWLAQPATRREPGDSFEATRGFYLTHRDKMILDPDVRRWIESELAIPQVRETGWRDPAVVLASQLHAPTALFANDPVVAPGGRRGVFLGYKRGKALIKLLHTDQLMLVDERTLQRV